MCDLRARGLMKAPPPYTDSTNWPVQFNGITLRQIRAIEANIIRRYLLYSVTKIYHREPASLQRAMKGIPPHLPWQYIKLPIC